MTVISTDPFPLSSIFQVLFIDYTQTSSRAGWAVPPSRELCVLRNPGQELPIYPLSPLSFLRNRKKEPSLWDSGKNGTKNAWFCLFNLLVHYRAFDFILTWDKSPWTTLLWCYSCNKCEPIMFVPGSGTWQWDLELMVNNQIILAREKTNIFHFISDYSAPHASTIPVLLCIILN